MILTFKQRWTQIKKSMGEFLFGAMTFELYRESIHLAKLYNDAVELLLLGHFLGVPFLPNYYTMRLLPFLVDKTTLFKKNSLTEVDIFALIGESGAH